MRKTFLSNHFGDLLKKSLVYSSASIVDEICRPLFDHFPISYFSYSRDYNDNRPLLLLISNKDWLYHYTVNCYPFLIRPEEIRTWTTTMPGKALKEAGSYLNLFNGVVISKTYPQYTERVELAAANPYENPIEIFFNHRDLLNQFVLYFKDKTSTLMKELLDNPFIFPETMFSENRSVAFSYEKFRASIHMKKIFMNFNSESVGFSKREFEVLWQLATGKSMKEVAIELEISNRTAESYLKNAKNKAQDFSTKYLIEYFRKNLF